MTRYSRLLCLRLELAVALAVLQRVPLSSQCSFWDQVRCGVSAVAVLHASTRGLTATSAFSMAMAVACSTPLTYHFGRHLLLEYPFKPLGYRRHPRFKRECLSVVF